MIWSSIELVYNSGHLEIYDHISVANCIVTSPFSMFRLLALVALCAAPLNGYMMQRAAGDMLGMTNPDSMMGHMDMGGDIHAHHRCCAHDVWHGTIYFEETALKNGSMTPTLEEVMQLSSATTN